METETSKYTIENPQPIILIISGLSGSGKDTVINRVQEISGRIFHFVVTCNTRPRRENEIDGVDYHFISRDRFLQMIEDGEMLEHSEVYEDLKGVPRFEVDNAFQVGKDIVMRLDTQGMQKVKAVYPNAVSIFILPPDSQEWIKRLRSRKTESEESLRIRIQTAEKELKGISAFDYIVVNKEVDQAAGDILTILEAERMSSTNRKVNVNFDE